MSATSRDSAIFRSIGNLRRSIIGRFSRKKSHGDASIHSRGAESLPVATRHGGCSTDSLDVGNRGVASIGGGRRSDHHLTPYPQFHPPEDPFVLPDEWGFLMSFEQQYGSTHPNFYACHFMEALKLAEQEHKFIFMYLHSPEHPFTPTFCKEILCSELAIQFLDVNFVCWSALADRGEGLQITASLYPTTFPFCAVIAPAPDASYAMLQKIEGPVSLEVLIEILQKILEEKGLPFGRDRVKREENIRADRRLREEQDAAYLQALQMDREKEKLKNQVSTERTHRQEVLGSNTSHGERRGANFNQVRQTTTSGASRQNGIARPGNDSQVTQILLRFPNAERREHSFLCTDKVQSIFRYIDSLSLPQIGNYRLVSNFPRRLYGVDQMGITLKDAGLHPKASLFLEPEHN